VEGSPETRLDVHHAWLLEDLPSGRVRILTQEARIGKPAQELARTKPNPMLNAHQEWVGRAGPRCSSAGEVLDAAGLFGRGAIGSLSDHRSLCEPSHGAKLHVLDGGLLPDGDEGRRAPNRGRGVYSVRVGCGDCYDRLARETERRHEINMLLLKLQSIDRVSRYRSRISPRSSLCVVAGPKSSHSM
jgi:hypothetical protein